MTAAAPSVDGREPGRRIELAFGAAMGGLGLLFLIVPSLLARRFQFATDDNVAAIARVLRAAGPSLLAMALGAGLSATRWAVERPRPAALIFGALVVLGYVSLTTSLSDWMIDDAAITFAYSKNLAAGHGLVISPGHAPEEGYSNTSWMLILAAARVMGGDIAVAAKRGCVTFGALTVALTLFACYRALGRRLRFSLLALGTAVCVGAPFIIWSSSGLEHSLQAAMLAAVVAAPLFESARLQRRITAAALSVLVLTRPEAPLIVALVAAVMVLRVPTWPAMREAVRAHFLTFAIPAATWAALMAFRLAYFHDAMSNPYYAKASDASWLRVVNFVGGGWSYLTSWLAEGRVWLVIPIALLAPLRRASVSLQIAISICLGQLLFVLFVAGDWMGCYRFVSPALPALALVVVSALAEAAERWSRLAAPAGSLVIVFFLGVGTLTQLSLFRAKPTTPTAIVAQIGRTFVDLGHRLGVEHPSLAHHDAGGTTYDAGIDLVDLGGLGDRAVAKHMGDRAFMRKYLFEDRRPTFVFGASRVFAAGATQFFLMPEFEAYVRLRFPSRPYMNADLCHVRRDVIHAIPGVHPSTETIDENGHPRTVDVWIVDN